MKGMLAIEGAVFAAFQTARSFLAIFFGRVVAASAFGARQSDDFSCHGQYLLKDSFFSNERGLAMTDLGKGFSFTPAHGGNPKMEPETRIELVTSSLPRTRSTI